MIRSFADKDTERVSWRLATKRFSIDLQRTAYRKLLVIDGVQAIDDLRIPPGNRLEKLEHDREGQFSIRVNMHWRIPFVWKDYDASEVKIVDYHA